MATNSDPRPLQLPFRGVSDKTTYAQQGGDFCPPSLMRNVIPYALGSKRFGIGTRPGLTKQIAQQLGNGKAIQAMAVVERAAGVTGLQKGDAITPTGTSRIAGPLHGHAFVLDPTGAMRIGLTDTRARGLAAAVAWHPTERRFVYGSYYTTGGLGTTGLNMYDLDGGRLWTAQLNDSASVPCYANQIVVGETYVFVAAAFWIWVFRTSDGAYVTRYDINGWSGEVMSIALRPDGFLVAAFFGTSQPATMANQPSLTQDPYSSQFKRSGVALFEVTNSDANPLVRTRYGETLVSTDPWYESDHGYARLSEILNRSPRGCIPFAMAVGPENEVLVGITNQGWAWESSAGSYNPDGTVGYTSLVKLDADGLLVFEVDTKSRRVPYTGGGWGVWYNDIPQIDGDDDYENTGTPKPSVNAVAVDSIGDIYVGGQRNLVSSTSIHKISGSTGAMIWSMDAGGCVEQHAMAIDPTDGNLWVGVMKNSAWTGSGGTAATLLKLNAITGTVLMSYITNPAPTNGVWGVAVNSRGDVAFTSDYI